MKYQNDKFYGATKDGRHYFFLDIGIDREGYRQIRLVNLKTFHSYCKFRFFDRPEHFELDGMDRIFKETIDLGFEIKQFNTSSDLFGWLA